MVEYHVWDCQLFIHVNYIITIFQLTVDGVSGVNGTHAARSVVEAPKDEPEPVTTPHLRTVERNVMGMLPK